MKKLAAWGFTLSACLSLVSSAGYTAGPTHWLGRFSDVTPVKANITKEYCKAHVLEDYITNMMQLEKEVKSNNGVIAKNIKNTTREEGGIYFISGTATFSGKYQGKTFEETAHYYAHSLTKNGVQKGVWYTDECKGWYELAPTADTGNVSQMRQIPKQNPPAHLKKLAPTTPKKQ